MRSIVEKLCTAASHFAVLNEFFLAESDEYRNMHAKIEALASYAQMAELFYPNYKQRQMALFDLTYFVVAGRSWWVASKSAAGKSDYIRFVLYFVNLLCIQEHLACSNPGFRERLLNHMQKAGLAGFLRDVQERSAYESCKKVQGLIKATRKDPNYVVVDGLLPKSIGNAIELIVFVSLLQSDIGFPVLLQLQQRLMMKGLEIVSPDLLLLGRDGRVYGVEIGQGTGQFSLKDSKVRQINDFVSHTKLPSLTAIVPIPYRCPECNQWILFCDQVIDEFSAAGRPKERVTKECPSCPHYKRGQCPDVIYVGRIEAGGESLHHHLRCVRNIAYVKKVLGKKAERESRLCNYFPHFQGLEGLEGRR